MALDISKIVSDKIKELDENKIIEQAIQSKIESVITSAVNDAFDYEFSRMISKKIKEQVGDIASSISLSSYNTMVSNTVKNILQAELNEDLANKVQSKVRELCLGSDKAVKLSDIVKKFKEENFEVDEDYSYSVVKSSERKCGSFTYMCFTFTSDNHDDEECWEIEFSRYNGEGKWTIYKAQYKNKVFYWYSGMSSVKNYDNFECFLWRCILNNISIEIDWSPEDCEEELYQSSEF